MTNVAAELRRHQGRRAGLVTRLIADAVDLGAVTAAVAVVYLAGGAFRFVLEDGQYRWPAPGAAPLGTLAWLLLVVYLTLSWATTGRTLGKQLMGLRVLDRHGHKLRAGTALARALLCVIVPAGLAWCAVSRERRSLADVVLGTAVVYDWQRRVP